LELQEHNISVNELIPGPVKTDMTRDVPIPPGEWFKDPEDVVPLALFLASMPDVGPTAQSYSLMRRA
jgi:3-oxoacyl-[acyl-carrier protein] reductase